jgi:hypothetical protein
VTITADRDGRRRLWYTPTEIERLCEEQLTRSGLLPDEDSCIVDIEALVENVLGAAVDYSATLAPSVLGYTVFEQPPRVVISRTLTEGATGPDAPPGLVGRWRATLAHEAAHILLHSALFSASPRVPGAPLQRPVRCLRSTVDQDQPRSDWREVQANMGMAALLMPKTVFDCAAAGVLREASPLAVPPLAPQDQAIGTMVAALAARFAVSKQATRIRLETCGFVRAQG